MKKGNKLALAIMSSLLVFGMTACGSTKETSGGASEEKKTGYPTKAITVVAPSGAGGGWDVTARSFTKILAETKLVEQSMIVENKPGGGGAVFLAEYANQDTKNNDKLFVNSPPILINHVKREGNSPFGYKDTTPLAQLTKDYGAIVVKADSRYQDLKALLDDMKANPSKITLAGGSAPGSMDHLIGILPAHKYGIKASTVKYVSYDGGGEALTALLGNNADVIATDASSVREFLKAGKIRILAITAPERLEGELKDIPTAKEQGVDAEFVIWRGVFGPKEMSTEAFAFWQDTIAKLVKTDEWNNELQAQGWGSDYKDGEQFKKFLVKQEKQIQDLLKALDMAK